MRRACADACGALGAAGNYDTYCKSVRDNEVIQQKAYEKEQADIKHIKEFIASCGTYANLVKQAKSKQKILDKMARRPLVPAPYGYYCRACRCLHNLAASLLQRPGAHAVRATAAGVCVAGLCDAVRACGAGDAVRAAAERSNPRVGRSMRRA